MTERDAHIPVIVEPTGSYDGDMPDDGELLYAPGDIKSRMEALLKTVPGESEFSMSTATYCERAVTLAVDKYKGILSNALGQDAQPYIDRLHTLYSTPEPLPTSSIVDTEAGVRLQTGLGALDHLNALQLAIIFRNKQLGVYHPMASLKYTYGSDVAQQRLPSFNDRFKRILDTTGTDLTDPRAQFMAVGYINQAAKFLARNGAITLMKRLVNTTTLVTDPPSSVDTHFAFIEQSVRSVRQLNQFMDMSSHEQMKIAAENQFSDDQQEVMNDLAYMHKNAVNDTGHFSSMLDGLASYVFAEEPDWVAAIAHRDFILQYLYDSFPRWRTRAIRMSDQPTSGSLVSLKRKIREGSILLREDDVPPLLMGLLESHVVRNSAIDEESRQQELLQRSEFLSREMIDQIALETEMHVRRKSLIKRVGLSSYGIFDILRRKDLSEEDKRNYFIRVWQGVFKSTTTPEKARAEFEYYNSKFNGEKPALQMLLFPRGGNMYGPITEKKFVRRVGKSSSSHTVEFHYDAYPRESEDPQRLDIVEPERYSDRIKYLGRVYFRLIQGTLKTRVNSSSPLDREQLLSAMRRAYAIFCADHPEKATFTLSEYLRTMAQRAPHLDVNFKEHYNDIFDFINSID